MPALALPLEARPGTSDNKWLVTASISFGALMATIDLSIVNVALPQIRGSIGASIDEMAALATSFAIAQVIVMPLTAFLGRFFGQKRVYLFCLGLVPLRRRCCAAWPGRWCSSSSRARSRASAPASLQPTQLAILRQTFPPDEQGMAMAMFAMVGGDRPRDRPDAGRLDRRQLVVAVDLLHQPARRACSAS